MSWPGSVYFVGVTFDLAKAGEFGCPPYAPEALKAKTEMRFTPQGPWKLPERSPIEHVRQLARKHARGLN